MANTRYDRSVESTALPTYDNIGAFTDPKLYRCMIIRKYSPEEKTSNQKAVLNKQVLYEVVILGGVKNGQLISNVRCSYTLGGKNNRSEMVLQPCTDWEEVRSKPDKWDGDVAYVLFNQGDTSVPVIIAYDKNLQNAYTFEDYVGTGSSEQIQGVETNHSSEGEFSHIIKGGTKNPTTGEFDPTANVDDYWQTFVSIKGLVEFKNKIKTMFMADWNGNVEISTLAGAKYKIQNSNKIALGAQGIELLQQISQQLADIATHTHPAPPVVAYALVAGSVSPIIPPPPVGTVPAPSNAGDFTAIKAKIDQIKGTL